MKILVVENNTALRCPVTQGLRSAGFEVTEAADAAEAEVLQTEVFDVLFADIDLPGGRDGWEVASRFRAAHPGIAVIYTSGFTVDRSGEVPGSVYIRKPYRVSQVISAVVDLVNVRHRYLGTQGQNAFGDSESRLVSLTAGRDAAGIARESTLAGKHQLGPILESNG